MTARPLVLAALCWLFTGCSAGRSAPTPAWEMGIAELVTSRGATRIAVRIASTERQREVGLRGVEALDEDEGMWFAFDTDQPGEQGPWMRGVSLPLTVAFVDSGGAIVAIREMEPCGRPLGLGCPRYAPGVPYRAALEGRPELFERAGARVGDRLRLVARTSGLRDDGQDHAGDDDDADVPPERAALELGGVDGVGGVAGRT